MGGRITRSQIKERELYGLIKTLLGMTGDKAESIHLHKKDFEKVQASPGAYGLSLANNKEIVAVKDGRTIVVRPAE